MTFTHDVMCHMLGSHASVRTAFQAYYITGQMRSCFSILVSYHYDIIKPKDVFAIKHVISLRTPCVKYLTTLDTDKNPQCEGARTLPEKKLDTNSVLSKTTLPASQHQNHAFANGTRLQ